MILKCKIYRARGTRESGIVGKSISNAMLRRIVAEYENYRELHRNDRIGKILVSVTWLIHY